MPSECGCCADPLGYTERVARLVHSRQFANPLPVAHTHTHTHSHTLTHHRRIRSLEQPEIASMESSVAVLAAQKAQLDREASTVRSAGIEQKNATTAMLDAIVSGHVGACIHIYRSWPSSIPPPLQTPTPSSLAQANASAQVASIKRDISATSNQFVGSPKRIKDGLEAVARAVDAARGEASAQEDNRRALLRRTEVVVKAEKDVAKAMTLLAELEVGAWGQYTGFGDGDACREEAASTLRINPSILYLYARPSPSPARDQAEMSKHKSATTELKKRQKELDVATAALSETSSQVKHAEELLRVKEAKLAELKAEYAARCGSTDQGILALRTELAGMQQALAAARAARTEADTRKAQLEEAVRSGGHGHGQHAECVCYHYT